MKISSTRELSSLKDVLKNVNSIGVDPVYWVFSGVSKNKWENITVLAPGNIGEEFTKTYGHYHSTDVNETYKVLSGEGLLILQKKHFENGVFIPEIIDEVKIIKGSAGDEFVITPEYGHSWSNISDEPLVTLDDWRWGHKPEDYEYMKNFQGMCYYVIKNGDSFQLIKNLKYKTVPAFAFLLN